MHVHCCILNLPLDLTSISNLLAIIDRSWSVQLKDMIIAAIVNIVWGIWYARNKCRFDNKLIPFKSITSMISVDIRRTGTITHGTMFSSIAEFKILKHFSIPCHARAAPIIKQIEWIPPMCYWFKCNTDGAKKDLQGRPLVGAPFVITGLPL